MLFVSLKGFEERQAAADKADALIRDASHEFAKDQEAVLVPVKAFGKAKVRLAPALSGPERAALAQKMATRVVASAAGHAPAIHPDTATPRPWREVLAFAGPGALVAVGYVDPGNWATDIAGGSRFSYALLSVVLVSSLVAVLLIAALVLAIVDRWRKRSAISRQAKARRPASREKNPSLAWFLSRNPSSMRVVNCFTSPHIESTYYACGERPLSGSVGAQ